ncbi:hypothetical protein [Pseudomonas delhiensis]|nr:hypothetical protein [Pseudomonas delhiensis]
MLIIAAAVKNRGLNIEAKANRSNAGADETATLSHPTGKKRRPKAP